MHELPIKNFATLFYGEIPHEIEEWCDSFLKRIKNNSNHITPYVVRIWIEELYNLDKMYQDSDAMTLKHQMSVAEKRYDLGNFFKYLPIIVKKRNLSTYDLRIKRNVKRITNETVSMMSQCLQNRIYPPETPLLQIESSNNRFWCEYTGSIENLNELINFTNSATMIRPEMVFQLRRKIVDSDGSIYAGTDLEKALLTIGIGKNRELYLFEEVHEAYKNDVRLFALEIKDHISIIDNEYHQNNSRLIYFLYKELNLTIPLKYLPYHENQFVDGARLHFKSNTNVEIFFNQILFTFDVTDLYRFFKYSQERLTTEMLMEIDDMLNKKSVRYKKYYSWDRIRKDMIMAEYSLEENQLDKFRNFYVNDYYLNEAYEKAIDIEVQSELLRKKICDAFQIHVSGNVCKMDFKKHLQEVAKNSIIVKPLSIDVWDILNDYYSSMSRRIKLSYTFEEEKQNPKIKHLPYTMPITADLTRELIQIINFHYDKQQIISEFN